MFEGYGFVGGLDTERGKIFESRTHAEVFVLGNQEDATLSYIEIGR